MPARFNTSMAACTDFAPMKLVISGLLFQLDASKPAASVLWPESRSPTKVVLSACSISLLQDDCVYSGKTNGHFVCLDANDGKTLWDTDQVTGKGQELETRPLN